MIFFVQDLFVDHYKGGAELTSEAIIQGGLYPVNKVIASQLTPKIMEEYRHVYWIFGNFADLSKECILYATKNLNYSVIEYDYKFCSYRSPGKHALMAGKCDCHQGIGGKIISLFYNNADVLWWMSQKQMEIYHNFFPFLRNENSRVLSSVFSEETLAFINNLDKTKKSDKWIILNSPSWIKGVDEAIEYAEKNNLEYELVWGLEHKEVLNKLASSKGTIFFPRAGDTCPRMTIEARLLDCELILNDNVQHKDEKWFSNRETTLEHLKKRTDIFWDDMEAIYTHFLPLPKITDSLEYFSKEENKFKFVIPFYNCEEWIAKCIRSVQKQTYGNFECVLVDDLSTDNSVEIVKELIHDDNRFKLVVNEEKKYALGNIVGAIDGFNCEDEDVIILLDGDDWLASRRTLSELNGAYDENTFMTYGSYAFNPTGQIGPEPSEYPSEVIENNSFRTDEWRASHLRSFKYKLWKNINLDDLKCDTGFYKMAYDQAIMLPLLEMASERSKYIPTVLLVYNKLNPLNVDKVKAEEQAFTAQQIRQKKPYTRI